MYASDDQDCLLCGPGNVEELAGAFHRLVEDNEFRVRLSAGARKAAGSQFECETVSARFLKQMDRV
jgi:glycosyltransferase involved in cell wall biosynthesis